MAITKNECTSQGRAHGQAPPVSGGRGSSPWKDNRRACAEGKATLAGPEGLVSRRGRKTSLCCTGCRAGLGWEGLTIPDHTTGEDEGPHWQMRKGCGQTTCSKQCS